MSSASPATSVCGVLSIRRCKRRPRCMSRQGRRCVSSPSSLIKPTTLGIGRDVWSPRLSRRQRKSPLSGHIAGGCALARAEAVRATVLRPWRHRKPHQRTVFVVRRASQRGYAASQSTTPVSFGCCLCADERLSPARPSRHCLVASAMRDHPLTTAPRWRSGAHHSPQSLDLDR